MVVIYSSDGLLIVRYIKKMGTDGGGGGVDDVPLRLLLAIWSRVEIPFFLFR